MIAVSELRVPEEAETLVLQVLRSGKLAQGPLVERFEHLFADVTGSAHAVAVANGTAALVAALRVTGIGRGDEVIVPAFTFGATLNAVLEVGATAVCVDIDESLTIATDAIADSIGPRTAAVIPVHLFGRPADMSAILELAERANLAVIEDAAQGLGASHGGRPAGSFGIGCFSTYATKTVFTGEGGVLTTSDADIADQLKILRNQGMARAYEYLGPGINMRLTDLAAAIGIPQLEQLPEILTQRSRNAEYLTANLDHIRGVTLPQHGEPGDHAWHQYTIRVQRSATMDRDRAAAKLAELGVETRVYYPKALSQYAFFVSHPRVVFMPTPRAEQAAEEVLSIPVHQWLSPSDLERVTHSVRAACHD
jgi:perosamine synthetase